MKSQIYLFYVFISNVFSNENKNEFFKKRRLVFFYFHNTRRRRVLLISLKIVVFFGVWINEHLIIYFKKAME